MTIKNRHPERPFRARAYFHSGSIAHAMILLIGVLSAMIVSSLILSRSISTLSSAVDYVQQTSVELRTFERIAAESVLAKAEVAVANNPATLDSIVDGFVTLVNSGSTGLSFARSGATTAIPAVLMYPDASRPAISTPSLSTAGFRYQIKSLIAGGAASLGTMTFNFTRTTTSNMVAGDTRNIQTYAQLWSVPLSNWSVIPYGQPASVAAGAGVPQVAPAGPKGATPMLLTTLRPSPAYSPGDASAFDHLYSPPVGSVETLPLYYRSMVSICWNVWEYVWNSYVPTLATIGSSTFDFGAYNPVAPTGVTINSPGSITVNLQSVPTGTLSIIDSVGGGIINLVGSATNPSPLVVVVYNATSTRSVVSLSGNNSRSVLLYLTRSTTTISGTPTWAGAIYTDRDTTMNGTMTISGNFAYAATNPPFGSLSLTMSTAAAQVATDLRDMSPRVLLISTSSQLQ